MKMPNNNYNVHLYTIGGVNYGFGHIARLIPVYDTFNTNGFSPIFYVDGDKTVSRLLKNKRYLINNWLNEKVLSIKESDIVIIDTLIFPLDFFEKVKFDTSNIFFISDDYINEPFPAKIINWRVNSKTHHNQGKNLNGEKFVPLREEIIKYRNCKKNENEVIISMGGNDVLNLIPPTIEVLLNEFGNTLKIKAIISKNHKEFSNIISKYGKKITFLYDLNAKQLFREMAVSEFAIASGGHTIYEFAYLGTPVVHVLLVDNQKPALEWNKTHFTYPVGWYNPKTYSKNIIEGVRFFLNPDNLNKAKVIGQKLIDDKGAQRIFQHLTNQL